MSQTKKKRLFLILIIICLSFSGCITYDAPPDADPSKNGSNPVLSHDFDYTHDPIPPQVGIPKSEGRFTVTEVVFHTNRQSTQPDLKNPLIPTRFYQPTVPGPRPAVVILPVTRGDYPTKAVAAYLADRGIASLLFMSRSTFTGTAGKDFSTLAAQFH
ncbi:MAG TPA: hypothetical protein VNV63_05945, partial [Nitrospiria bacterium]|nr:hypothetical protein [Nitrospiria bacterium]